MDLELDRPRILIAGLGNVLMRDDGVGVHAVRKLKVESLQGVLVVEVGTAVLEALHLFEWAHRILAIDAMQGNGPPGAIYALAVDDVAQPGSQTSLHELNLLRALRFLTCPVKPQISLLGVEPEIIAYGTELSPSLEEAMPRLLQTVKNLVAYWRGLPTLQTNGPPVQGMGQEEP